MLFRGGTGFLKNIIFTHYLAHYLLFMVHHTDSR